MDKIFLRRVAIPALIGVHEQEKILPQIIFLDVEAAVDALRAASADTIDLTVDYAAIYHFLHEYIAGVRFQLLETLAVNLCDQLIKKFSLSWLRLTITKNPADLPDLDGAGIIIEREASSLRGA